MFSRTEELIGFDNLQKLQNSNIIVFGIGGVGGYVVEMLVRSGVGNITIVDFDKISVSNLNRQIIATVNTIGKYKVDVMEERIKSINPNCNVKKYVFKVDKDNLPYLMDGQYDYCIDAIDMVENKADLIEYCYKNNINIISALGAGNRYKLPEFKVCDVYQTHNDGLAKKMRKLLKSRNVEKLQVVYTDETAEKTTKTASMVYYPAMCGCLISSVVVNNLLQKQL